MGKWVDDALKVNFIEQFEDQLIQLDENAATFEFEYDGNPYILHKSLKDFLDVLDMVFSDFQVRIAKTSGHPALQVFMKLEEGLWKPK